jgi:hypothetical protein
VTGFGYVDTYTYLSIYPYLSEYARGIRISDIGYRISDIGYRELEIRSFHPEFSSGVKETSLQLQHMLVARAVVAVIQDDEKRFFREETFLPPL